MSGSVIELVEIAVGGRPLAILGASVAAVHDARSWAGAAPLDLAHALGVSTAGAETATKVLVLETPAGSVPVAVHAVRSLARVAAEEVLPLPARVRRHAPALLALAALPSGPTLVVDPEGLSLLSKPAGGPR